MSYKENVPLTMVEMDNKGILFIYFIIYLPCVWVSGVQQDPQLAYSLSQMGQAVDPYYAMASMYPPGSRER